MTVVTRPRSRAHTVIAVAALAWNLLGLALFLMQLSMSDAQVAALAPPDRAMYEATPAWVLGAFGVAVVAGVVGSVGLITRQRWAVAALAASLLAILVQVAGTFATTPAWQTYGPAGLIMPLVLTTIAVLLLRYAQRVTS
jgi:hypothetical protein